MRKLTEKERLVEYWDRWQLNGDKEACDHLIEEYLPLVDFHVQRIAAGLPRNVQQDDLRSHGMMGLYDALAKFDTSRELKFDTYASFRIRGAIIDGLRQEDWLPRSMREKAKKIEAAQERIEQRLGRNAQASEIASELEMPEQEVLQVVNESLVSHLLSIDESTNEGENEDSFAATIIDHHMKTPEEQAILSAKYNDLAEKIKNLTENEQLVVSLFYFEELTLTEIGYILKLSTSRISQIHSKALFRLQRAFDTQN